MFCGKCGNEMTGNERFCGNCGNPIKVPLQDTLHRQQKKKSSSLIYESKGISSIRKNLLIISSLLMCFSGVGIAIIANYYRSGAKVYSSLGELGTIGGGYLFDSDVRGKITIFGVFIALMGIACFVDLFYLKQNFFRVYDDHIEGCIITVIFFVFKKEFSLKYSQIVDLQKLHGLGNHIMLRIVSAGGNYGVELFEDEEKVYQYIRSNIEEG